jgi:hypothetical protein
MVYQLRYDMRYQPGSWFQVFVDHPAIQMIEVIYGPGYVNDIIDIIWNRHPEHTKHDAQQLIKYAVMEFKVGLYIYQHPEAFEHSQGPDQKMNNGILVHPKSTLDLEKIAEAVKIPMDDMEKLIQFWDYYPGESPGRRILELVDLFKKKGFPSRPSLPDHPFQRKRRNQKTVMDALT